MESDTDQAYRPDATQRLDEGTENSQGTFAGRQNATSTMDDTRSDTGAGLTGREESSPTTSGGGMSGTLERETVSSSDTGTVRGVDSPEEMPPFNEEHPLGVGQQCYKCGAYNAFEAENCWNCNEKLTHSMAETPGIAESAAGPEADAVNTGASDEASDSEISGGASPIMPH